MGRTVPLQKPSSFHHGVTTQSGNLGETYGKCVLVFCHFGIVCTCVCCVCTDLCPPLFPLLYPLETGLSLNMKVMVFA